MTAKPQAAAVDRFLFGIVMVSLMFSGLLVGGVLFGPFDIDPTSVALISLVTQPGGVAIGGLIMRKKGDDPLAAGS